MIKVSVYLNETARLSDKKVYERQIEWDESLHFPFSSMIQNFRILYGSKCIVSFEVFASNI